MGCRLLAALAVSSLSGSAALAIDWVQGSTVAPGVTRYDMAVSGGVAHVAYAAGGTVYYTHKAYMDEAWSAPVALGAGTSPSVTVAGGEPVVAFLGSEIEVATRSGGTWGSALLGTVGGTVRVMVRTDGAGAVHLLSEGGNRGSIDVATNSGSGWGAFGNLATGFYDSGARYGQYYHEAILATDPGMAGYRIGLRVDDWGGQASYSQRSYATWYFGTETGGAFGWNSASSLGTSGLARRDGQAAFGYMRDGTGTVAAFDGDTWTTSDLGAANLVAVDFASGPLAVLDRAGSLYDWEGTGAPAALLFEGAAVSGSGPFLVGDGSSEHLLFIDAGGGLEYLSTVVPEPGSWAALVAFAAGARVLSRRRRC